MSRVDWAIARYNWYRACGLLDEPPRQTAAVANDHRTPDPPPPRPHLKWYPLRKPAEVVTTTSHQPVAAIQRHRYSQRVDKTHPKVISPRSHAEKRLGDDPRTWSRVDWAIARYNWYRACGLLSDSSQQVAETTNYQRSPAPPPPKPQLKWYPLSKPNDDLATVYRRAAATTARAVATLAHYQAEKEKSPKGTGPNRTFVESEHDRIPAGQSDGGRFRAMNQGNGSAIPPSRPKLRRADTLETGTGHIWDVDGRPWELTRQQIKDWDAITSRSAWSEGLHAILPSFWTSIADFEAEVRRQARSYRDQILRVEGSAVDANPIDLANRRRDRAQAALQKDFAKAATTVDNLTFMASLAKAPVKLGVKTLTNTAERQAAAAMGAKARSLAASQARSAIGPPTGAATNIVQTDARKIAKAVENVGSIAETPKPILRLTHQPTTLTLDDVRALPQPMKWKEGEKHIRQLSGSEGQRHFPVLKGGDIHGSGGRFVDALVDLPNGTVLANEVKTYGQWRTVNGVMQNQTVPPSNAIREQIAKDVWLRNNQGHDPRWIFLDAPPSRDLLDSLKHNRIITVTHGR
jgi:hypothetical protein